VLNNRELASVIIIGALVTLCCLSRDLRRSLGRVAAAAFTPKLTFLWVLYAAVIGAAEFGLHRAGLRYPDSVKDAAVWGVIAGLPIYVKFDQASKDPELLARALFDALRLTALVEFFVNLYVFPLWVELPLQIVLLVVGVLAAYANVDSSTPANLRGCLSSATPVLGLALILTVAVHVGTNAHQINWRDTGMAFAQPVGLTVAAVLATTVVAFISAYEIALGVQLTYPLRDARPHLRHRLALIIGLTWRLRHVRQFGGAVSVRLRRTATFHSALQVVRDYRRGKIGPSDWPDLA
jgi:hypothetical protein